jgi:23S rRNA G2069 N7-methylase RlmK/C1962 C5-methylase RlmI
MPPSGKSLQQAEFFSNRLQKNEKQLRKWARKHDFNAIRLYDRDIPEIPLVVERYKNDSDSALVIALYERPYEKDEAEESEWFDLMAGHAAEVLEIDPSRIFPKTRKKMKGFSQYSKLEGQGFEMSVAEAGLKFKVNLSDYLDTGLFLDHRPARGVVRASASGLRVLNLFSYTGAFSVYAAAGGASSVVSVDLSNTYLSWAKENFQLNLIEESQHEFIKSDVAEFLDDAAGAMESWDLIIVDPPTFSNSTMAKGDFDVNRDWEGLLKSCASVLAPNGAIIFSTNSRQMKWDPTRLVLPSKDISDLTIPADFRNKRIHRCWIVGNESLLRLSDLAAGAS